MFNRVSESTRAKKQWYRLGKRLPILNADTLLSDKRYVYYIEQVKQRAQLPDEHFNHFYYGFIQRFAEFVQLIPEGPDTALGSLLTTGLLRGLNTLHFFLQKFDQATPVERYALFTATVLRDIQAVVTQQKVLITDEGGGHNRNVATFLWAYDGRVQWSIL